MVRMVRIGSMAFNPPFFFSGPKLVIIKDRAISIQIAVALTCNRDVSACAVVPKNVRNVITDFR